MVKIQQVKRDLNNALTHLEKLINASKGDNSECDVRSFNDIELYVRTYIIAPIETARNEVSRHY